MNTDFFSRSVRHSFVIAVAAIACTTILSPTTAWGANGGYVVDDAEAAAAGACRVEAWASFADNKDFIGAAAPACGIPFLKPAELGLLFLRTRVDGEWGSNIAIKAKVNLYPADVGKLGVGVSANWAVDPATGETTAVLATIPFTFKFSDTFRIHLNGGWAWDRPNDLHFATYGAALEWEFVKSWTFIAEVFGLAGSAPVTSTIKPRFQAGLRYTPIDSLDLDLIYGRNIAGEDANWITVGVNVRFPVIGGK